MKITRHELKSLIKQVIEENLYPTDTYRKIVFTHEGSDDMFDQYKPDLSVIGIEDSGDSYIYTNKKRHLHFGIDPSLQKKGLAALMIKAWVYREGPVIIPKGRIVNDLVYKVLDKIKTDDKFQVSDEGSYFEISEN